MFSATAYSSRRVFPVDPIYVADFETLRGITTSSMLCFITGFFSAGTDVAGAGWFIRDDNDTTSADNGSTIIVATNGKRWKKMFDDVGFASVETYADLREFEYDIPVVEVIGVTAAAPQGTTGTFYRDSTDVTSVDNGGTVIVGNNGWRWKRKIDNNLVSPRWFGAVPGTTDSTLAVGNAIAECFRIGASLIVDGDYSLYDPIVKSGVNAIGLVGMSVSTSRFCYQTTDAIIDLSITSPDSVGEYNISNVAFASNVTDCVTALKLTGVVPGAGRKVTGAKIDHCYFGYDSHTGTAGTRCFQTGLWTNTCRDTTINQTIFYGKRNVRTGNGFYFEGDGTSGPTLTACEFFHWNYGITKLATGLVSSEGLRCTNCIFVTNNWGIHCESPIGDPAVVLIGNHFNCEEGGVWLKNHNYITHANNFYIANTASTTYIDIYVETCDLGFTSHDNFYSNTTAAATAKGIVIAGNSNEISIHNENFIGACRLNALVLGAACSRVTVTDNHWEGIAVPVVNNITDRTKYVRRSYLAPGYAKASAPTAQALVSGTDTAIIWQLANVAMTHSSMWSAAQPTRFVVPPDVTLVRLSGNGSFENNVTGSRIVKITKNGINFDTMAHVRVDATTVGGTVLNVATGICEVVAGDYFELVLTQTSGGALNTSNTVLNNFCMEIVG